MYKLICMSFDGAYVIERDRFHETFETVEETWSHENNMGSKWYFYPFHFVVTKSGKSIVDTGRGLERFKGQRVTSVARTFKQLSERADMQNADPDTFAMELQFA